jgi:hypothetical protein
VHSSFFEPAGPGEFIATPATAGPWSAQSQHGGPPSALMGRAFELHEPAAGQRLARVMVDILGPVPVGKVAVRTRTIRPGRRVSLLEGALEADGREVLHARGWRIARPAGPVPEVTQNAALPPIPAEDVTPRFPGGGHADGYLAAVEWRFVTGGFGDYRPSSAWLRPRIPLLPGEKPSPMSQALLLGDSGSGVGMALDPARFLSINVDLTVVLPRDPAGEWLLLEADTMIGGQGTGLTRTSLSDAGGRCGTVLQTLLVEPR